MNYQYRRELLESATGALHADEQGLVSALPTELGHAFVLNTCHDRIDQPAAALAEALGCLASARSSSPMARVLHGQRLPFLLNLVNDLSSRPHGWIRDALTAVGAAAASRTTAEARAQIVVAERAIRRGIGEVTQQIVSAA